MTTIVFGVGELTKLYERAEHMAKEAQAQVDLQEACDKLTNADLPEQLRLANNRIAALERRNKQLEGQKEYYRELFSEMSTLAHEMSRIADRFGDA